MWLPSGVLMQSQDDKNAELNQRLFSGEVVCVRLWHALLTAARCTDSRESRTGSISRGEVTVHRHCFGTNCVSSGARQFGDAGSTETYQEGEH